MFSLVIDFFWVSSGTIAIGRISHLYQRIHGFILQNMCRYKRTWWCSSPFRDFRKRWLKYDKRNHIEHIDENKHLWYNIYEHMFMVVKRWFIFLSCCGRFPMGPGFVRSEKSITNSILLLKNPVFYGVKMLKLHVFQYATRLPVCRLPFGCHLVTVWSTQVRLG